MQSDDRTVAEKTFSTPERTKKFDEHLLIAYLSTVLDDSKRSEKARHAADELRRQWGTAQLLPEPARTKTLNQLYELMVKFRNENQ